MLLLLLCCWPRSTTDEVEKDEDVAPARPGAAVAEEPAGDAIGQEAVVRDEETVTLAAGDILTSMSDVFTDATTEPTAYVYDGCSSHSLYMYV